MWQGDLTHDGGGPVFVPFDVLDYVPHMLGVEISRQSILMAPLCLLDANFLVQTI